jgi:4-hydroxybenzoate polyprenyltransferase
VSEAHVDTQQRTVPRSMVRIKAAILAAVFLASSVVLTIVPHWHDDALLAVAGCAAILFYFVRCESCHSSIYYRRGGRRAFPAGPNALAVLASKRCPECGRERI